MSNEVDIELRVSSKKALKDIQKINQNIKAVAKQTTTSKLALANFLGGAALNAAAAAASFALSSISSGIGTLVRKGADLEQLETRFATLTGSIDNAKKLLEELIRFSDTTPFTLDQVTNAAATLKSFGVENEKVVQTLQNLGDVSAATGSNLSEVALIFGQVSAAGKLTGERLLQLQERGVPVLDAVAKEMGVLKNEVQDLVAQGVVKFDIFEKALQGLTAEGGTFFGAMITQSKTLSGLFSTLESVVSTLAAEMGKELLPTLKEFARVAIETFVNNKEKILTYFREVISFLKPIGETLLGVIKLAVENADTLATLFRITTGPAKFILNVLGKIFDVTKAVVSGFHEWGKSIAKIFTGNKIEKTGDDIASINKEIERLNTLADQLEIRASQAFTAMGSQARFNAKAYQNEAKAIREQIKDLQRKKKEVMNLSGEKREIANVEKAPEIETRKRVNTKLEELRIQSQADEKLALINHQQELSSIRSEDAIKRVEEENIAEEEKNARIQEIRAKEINAQTEFETRKVEIVTNAELQKAQLIEKESDKKVAIEKANRTRDLEDLKIRNKQKIAEEKNTYKQIFDNQTATDKARLEWDRSTWQQRATNAQYGLSQLATLQNSNNKTMFRVGQAAAVANTTVATYQAATKAYSSLAGIPIVGPALGAAAAAAAVVAGLANIAKIKSQKFAQGGIVGGSSPVGDQVVARVNSDEMILNKTQQANLFNMANSGGNSSGLIDAINKLGDRIANMEIVLRSNDFEIARSTQRALNDGFVFAST